LIFGGEIPTLSGSLPPCTGSQSGGYDRAVIQDPRSGTTQRASDADRDRMVNTLSEALAVGRLDREEHARRLDLALRARTMGDLAPLAVDLPAPVPAAPGAPASVVGMFGPASRRGRWTVPGRLRAIAVCGEVTLDLREARLGSETHVVGTNVCARIVLRVPAGVSVVDHGRGFFCARHAHREAGEGTPTVHLHGTSLFGDVLVLEG
jgi:hypothetical protein